MSNVTPSLLYEPPPLTPKMLQQFAVVDLSGRTLFQHRGCSQIVTLTAALQQSGYCMKALLPFAGNYDLLRAPNPPAIVVVDWFFDAFPADSAGGSQLEGALAY